MSPTDKHFLNSSSSLVLESLQGLCALNPQLQLDATNKVVYQANPDRSKVALICGGGSGHEPAHAGFVGNGMLNAAVCGNVFASPNAGQVRRGIELVDNDKGTVIIVKNYTGDVLNFGLAKEQHAAQHPDKADRLRFVIVGEDVSVGRTQGDIVGRRGLAGTVLVYKIAGALARQGASLDAVHSIAQWVASRVGTIGVGLEHCHVPGTETHASHLSPSEVEIGMGIHNEPGHMRLSPIPPLNTLVNQLLELIISTADTERSFLPFHKSGNEAVLLVNNLGGLSELELGGIVGAATHALDERGVKVHRILAGSFMTSLNMPGFSLTLLLLPRESEPNAPSNAKLLSLLDEPVQAPGWKWSSTRLPIIPSQQKKEAAPATQVAAVSLRSQAPKIAAHDPQAFMLAIQRACKALIAAEPEITRMDTVAGDGDCGHTLKAGAVAVLKCLETGNITGQDIIGSVLAISQVAEDHMSGTSGALYSIFFSSLVQGLIAASSSTTGPGTSKLWSTALQIALTRLYTYTRARPPSRTLVDPLATFVQELAACPFADAVAAAGHSAEATRNVQAKAGRSAYVDSARLKEQQVPDPGAWGVKVILEGLLG